VNRRGIARALLAATVALFATGCATTPAADEALGPWTSGRLSLRVDATPTQPAQSLTAAFELRGSGRHGELRLLSPLGTQQAAARWSPGGAVLTTPEGSRVFPGLDELAREALGEPLPLAALPDWLRGRPWPDAPAVATAGGFEQLGWAIGLGRLADGFIEARRAAVPPVQLRVQIDRGD
jgi:outer membrane lipoprotein LolB